MFLLSSPCTLWRDNLQLMETFVPLLNTINTYCGSLYKTSTIFTSSNAAEQCINSRPVEMVFHAANRGSGSSGKDPCSGCVKRLARNASCGSTTDSSRKKRQLGRAVKFSAENRNRAGHRPVRCSNLISEAKFQRGASCQGEGRKHGSSKGCDAGICFTIFGFIFKKRTRLLLSLTAEKASGFIRLESYLWSKSMKVFS